MATYSNLFSVGIKSLGGIYAITQLPCDIAAIRYLGSPLGTPGYAIRVRHLNGEPKWRTLLSLAKPLVHKYVVKQVQSAGARVRQFGFAINGVPTTLYGRSL